MTQYRTQATRPDYTEPEIKDPTKSFGEIWGDFKQARRQAINRLSGWKKTLSIVAHGAALIFLPIFIFAAVAYLFSFAVVGAILFVLVMVGVVTLFCFIAADVVFNL